MYNFLFMEVLHPLKYFDNDVFPFIIAQQNIERFYFQESIQILTLDMLLDYMKFPSLDGLFIFLYEVLMFDYWIVVQIFRNPELGH